MSTAYLIRSVYLAAALTAPVALIGTVGCGKRPSGDDADVERAARRAIHVPRSASNARFNGSTHLVSGHYLGSVIVPCGSQQRLWLTADSAAALEPHVQPFLRPGAVTDDSLSVPLFVRVQAISSSQDPDHPNPTDDGGLRITQVLEVRPHHPDDCRQ